MQAHVCHREDGQQATRGKHQIQRENVSQNAENHGGQRAPAGGGGADEAQNRPPVFLRERQHHRRVEDAVAHRVGKACQEHAHTHDGIILCQIRQNEKKSRTQEAAAHAPVPGLWLQPHNPQQAYTQQRRGGFHAHKIPVHVHGKALFQGKGQHQRHGAGAQKIQNQRAGDEQLQVPVPENFPNRHAEIRKNPSKGDFLPLMHGFRYGDEQLGKGGNQIADAVEQHDQRHPQERDQRAADGLAHQIDKRVHAGKHGLPPHHIVMGNDVQHQCVDRRGEKHGAGRSQKRRRQHHGDAEAIREGQNPQRQHDHAPQRVHAHDDQLTAAFVDDAAAEGHDQHGHEHGDGGHNAHQGAGAGFLVNPIADGNAVEDISQGADGVALEHEDGIFVP